MTMAFPTVATVTRTILEGIDSATQKKPPEGGLTSFFAKAGTGPARVY